MTTLDEILAMKQARKTRLQAALASIVDQLKAMGAVRIILFGSLAVDDVDVCSDLDLLVIMPSTKDGRHWMETIYEVVDRGVDSDIIAFTEEEFKEHLKSSSFLDSIVRSGRVIYEKRL